MVQDAKLQHAVQRCNMALYGMQHATSHAANDIDGESPRQVRHAADNMQRTTDNRQHAACSTPVAARSGTLRAASKASAPMVRLDPFHSEGDLRTNRQTNKQTNKQTDIARRSHIPCVVRAAGAAARAWRGLTWRGLRTRGSAREHSRRTGGRTFDFEFLMMCPSSSMQ